MRLFRAGTRNTDQTSPRSNRVGGVFTVVVQDHLIHQEQKCVTPPASEEAIAQLVHMRLRAVVEQDTCLVCSEDLQDGCVVTRLPCGHMYHSECVVRWLYRNCTCPSCRFEMPTDDPTFELGREQRMKERDTVCTDIPETSAWVRDIRKLHINDFDCIISKAT